MAPPNGTSSLNLQQSTRRRPQTPIENEEIPAQADSTDGLSVHLNLDATIHEVIETTEDIAMAFIAEQLEGDGLPVPFKLQQTETISELGQHLKKMADKLNTDTKLKHLLSKICLKRQTPYEVFKAVAMEIFEDKIINFGKIVILFFFAYKLAVTALDVNIDLIYHVVHFVKLFVAEKLARWVAEQGGWPSLLRENFAMQVATGIFLSTVVVAIVYQYWWKR